MTVMHSILTIFFGKCDDEYQSIAVLFSAEQLGFVLTSVQPKDQIVARDEVEIGENFRNLFDSIRTDDAKKTETYRKVLVQQAEKEQESFDSLKGELRFSRQKNARKQGHFNERSDNTREKRQVCERRMTHAEMEEQFVKTYGGNNETSGLWQAVRDESTNIDFLKSVALRAHAFTYPFMKITPALIEKITFDTHRTLLTNFSQPIRLDTILYSIPNITLINFVICKGLEPNCVFYLHAHDIYTREPEHDHFETNPTGLKFGWHQCNITMV